MHKEIESEDQEENSEDDYDFTYEPTVPSFDEDDQFSCSNDDHSSENEKL